MSELRAKKTTDQLLSNIASLAHEQTAERRIQELINKLNSQESAVENFMEASEFQTIESNEAQIRVETERIKKKCTEIQDECKKFGEVLKSFKNREQLISDNANKSAEIVADIKENVKNVKQKLLEASKQLEEARQKHLELQATNMKS